MPSVLLLVNEEAHVRELSRVIDLLREGGGPRAVVYIEDRMLNYLRPDAFADKHVEVLTSKDVSVRAQQSLLPAARAAVQRKKAQGVLWLLRFLSRRFPARFGPLRDTLSLIEATRNHMLEKAALCEGVFAQRRYSALVISEDNVELDTAIWAAAARKNGVRSIVVPYTISNVAEFAESYVHYESYQTRFSTMNLLVARLFPKWALRFKGKWFLRSTYPRIIATELLGLSPRKPWFLNSGYADVIAVESEAMKRRYGAEKFSPRQLRITGSLADDVMAKAMTSTPRQAFLQSHGFKQDRPILVCAFPPDQNTFDRPGCEFTSFDEVIEFWCDALGKVEGWNVLIRPHPKTKRERLARFEKQGLTISYEDTATLVPFCDLYLAAASATIRWAIACGKPVINYDVYRYGYDDYDCLAGVVAVGTRREFLKMLDKMTGDDEFRRRLALAQQNVASQWGRLDGRCGERLMALLAPVQESVEA